MVEAIFNKLGVAGTAMVMGGVFMKQFVFIVDGGERALIMDNARGLQDHVYGEGMHFKVPFL
jgi:prohibitin 1